MNLLAHAVLAYSHEKLTDEAFLLGNMMADFTTGFAIDSFEPLIKLGIEHHRFIDSFTDASVPYKTLATKLREAGAPRHGSGILVDLFWDFVLASRWQDYGQKVTAMSLKDFAKKVYRGLESQKSHFTPVFSRICPWLIKENWLESYGTKQGIKKVLERIAFRLDHGKGFAGSEKLLSTTYSEIDETFAQFWPEVFQSSVDRIEKSLANFY